MNNYRERIQVNTAPLIREKLDNLQPGDDLAKLIRGTRRNFPADDPAQPEGKGLLHRLLKILTERKRKK